MLTDVAAVRPQGSAAWTVTYADGSTRHYEPGDLPPHASAWLLAHDPARPAPFASPDPEEYRTPRTLDPTEES